MCVCILSRWEQAEGTAVPFGLGLDLPGERLLRGGRGGRVPGGGAEAERLPGRDVFHRLVCLSFRPCHSLVLQSKTLCVCDNF